MTAWNFKDLTGMKFGRLTVIERAENKGKVAYWKCRCDCGNVTVVQAGHLTNGHTKSCGCLHGQNHGLRQTKIYSLWSRIKSRCLNPNCADYKDYGGRGIYVYSAWVDNFQAFYDYVSKLPHCGEKGYTLDRIDVNGNYEPNNIRWADAKTQARNRRSNHIVEYNGELITVMEVAEKSGISYSALLQRIRRGDTGERLFRPVKSVKPKE